MSDITLTASIRSNLLSLQNTTKLLDTTSERLSTGKRVNSALDNPSSFFTARGLSNRAADLTGRKDSIGQSISLLQATDKSINTITALVEQAKAVAQQAEEAATSGVSSIATQRAALTGTTTISTEALATATGSVSTISSATAAAATGAITTVSSATILQPRGGTVTADVTAAASGVAEAEQITLTGDYESGDVITVQIDNTTATTYTVSGGNITAGNRTATLASIAGQVATAVAAGAGPVSASSSAAVITITADSTNNSFTTTIDATNDVATIESIGVSSAGRTGSSLLTATSTFGANVGDVLTLAVGAGGSSALSSTNFSIGSTSTIDDLVSAITDLDSHVTATFNTASGEIEITASGGLEFTATNAARATVAQVTAQTAAGKEVETVTLQGTYEAGDVVSLQITDTGGTVIAGKGPDVFTVSAGNLTGNATANLTSIAAGVAAAVNAGFGGSVASDAVTATSSGGVITLTADSNADAFATSVSTLGTAVAQTATATAAGKEAETLTISGNYSVGDTITVGSNANATSTFTVSAGNLAGNSTANLNSIADGVIAAYNAGASGTAGSVTAAIGGPTSNVITFTELSNNQAFTLTVSTAEATGTALADFGFSSGAGTLVSGTAQTFDTAGAATDLVAKAFGATATDVLTFSVGGGEGSTNNVAFTIGTQTVAELVTAISNIDDDITASFNTTTNQIDITTASGGAVLTVAENTGTALTELAFNDGTSAVTAGNLTFATTQAATDTLVAAFAATATDVLSFDYAGTSVAFTVGNSTIAELVTAISSVDADITAAYNTTTNKIDITSSVGGAALTVSEINGTALTELVLNNGTSNVASGTTETFATTAAATDLVTSAFGVDASATFTLAFGGGGSATIRAGSLTVADLVTEIANVDSQLTASFNTTTNKIDISSATGQSVTFTDAATAVAQVDTFTFGGTIEAGDVFTANINGNTVSFTATGTTGDNVRDGLLAAINNDSTISGLVTATTGGTGELIITADTAGVQLNTSVLTSDAAGIADNQTVTKASTTAAVATGLVAGLALEGGAGALTSGTATTYTDTTASVTSGDLLTTAYSGVADGNSFTISTATGGTSTFTVSATTTIADLVTAIGASDSALTASYNTTSQAIEVSADTGTAVTFTNVSGTAISSLGLTNGTSSLTSGTAVTYGSSGSASEVGSLNTDFATILGQIDTLLNDASYKGTNLLKGGNDFVVKFNADGSSSLTLTGLDLGVTGNTNLKFTLDATGYDFTGTGIDTALADTQNAIDHLRSVAATFGTGLGIIQTREEFTSELVNVLQSGSDKLINANLEEESANLLALQTRQALGIQSLSIANQSQQSVLSLFR